MHHSPRHILARIAPDLDIGLFQISGDTFNSMNLQDITTARSGCNRKIDAEYETHSISRGKKARNRNTNLQVSRRGGGRAGCSAAQIRETKRRLAIAAKCGSEKREKGLVLRDIQYLAVRLRKVPGAKIAAEHNNLTHIEILRGRRCRNTKVVESDDRRNHQQFDKSAKQALHDYLHSGRKIYLEHLLRYGFLVMSPL